MSPDQEQQLQATDRKTAVYWLHHVHPTLTCGVGVCTGAERQCNECRSDETRIRNDERNKMRDGILNSLGLKTRHDSVQVRNV